MSRGLALAAAAVALTSDSPSAEHPATHRLVGYGCGPASLTLTAAEEDHFPSCQIIQPRF